VNLADERSGIAKLVHGDESRARELRANLAVFARRSGDPGMRTLVADVLAGRRNVRDVLRAKEFNDTGLRHVANIEKGLARLSEEQRADLFGPNRPGTPDEKLTELRDSYDVAAVAPDVPQPTGQPAPIDNEDDDPDRLIFE
jgi:hypothetical protein